MLTLSESDQKAAEKIVSSYGPAPVTSTYGDEQFLAYVEGTIEDMVAEGIAAGRAESATRIRELEALVEAAESCWVEGIAAGRAESATRIAELEALVDPLPVDAEGNKLTLGMTVFVERESGMEEGIIVRLCDDDTVRVRFPDGPVWEWHPLAEVHRDKPPKPEPKPPSGLLALLDRHTGWNLERLGIVTGMPLYMAEVAENSKRADMGDVRCIAACLGCSEDEVRAALVETKPEDE